MWKLPLVPHGQSLPERLIEEIQEVSRGLASKRISSQQTLGDFEESSHRCTTFQLSAKQKPSASFRKNFTSYLFRFRNNELVMVDGSSS